MYCCVVYDIRGNSVFLRDCCVCEEKITILNYLILSNTMVHFHYVQTDRAAMLDEIVDYVKFLRLQVKVKCYCAPQQSCFYFPS